ncbi:DUF7010 family protein [Parasphingorhabdus halotolerans]|uniref:Uncharacterized protein n=1 Tax=Parasphingorhabdus halotolerans TaxID=2725558 RepID=A0A6H2DM79_9SPHN|nr:hypothetical protein [Parasphingorhabdus halotolerans]QJB69782.1 hypothetical protein HF685_11240 [Parasphingorhabdus halotolerans]
MDRTATVEQLQTHFRETGTMSMPIAGMICWALLGGLALVLPDRTVGSLALYIMAGILPLAFLLDKAKGVNLFSGGDNPLTKMFLLSIVGIAVTVPAILIGAQAAGEPDIIVLGMAILAGVIWIPYGWAADDKVGVIHAVGRAVGCYVAYALIEEPYRATAICAVVVLSYLYSLIFMKKVGGAA